LIITDNFTTLLNNEIKQFNSFNKSHFYINRELSWLDFNKRVLHQSIRDEIPLLERLKFLGISSSNLDEFIMVRFSSLVNNVINERNNDISGLSYEEEYEKVLESIKEFKLLQNSSYKNLLKIINKNNIHICKYDNLTKKEREYIENIFNKNIYPLLTPMSYDTTKEFPPIKSKQLNIIVSLEDKYNKNLQVISIIPIEHLERLYKVETDDEINKYIFLEDIVFTFLNKIFVNKNILNKGCMRILKEGNIEIEHDKDIYLVDRMKSSLLLREYSEPIFMEVTDTLSKQVIKILMKMFKLNKSHVFKSDNLLDYSFLISMPIKNQILQYNEFNSQYPQELIGEHDMFTAIDNNDILLHHPYESFDPIVKFIEHASIDSNVVAIKQTLYRVSSKDSPIVEALCKAAINGKQVSVLLEIKARFDENRNISLIEKLKLAGCRIIYGMDELKTHCKFIVVVKRTHKGGLKLYSHLGTGNYNDKTSEIYTDLSYFTSNQKISEDLLHIFNILSGFSEPSTDINKLYFAPYNLRNKIYQLIDNEIKQAKNKKKTCITLKLNSLSDKDIIKKLYFASENGVKINIICRGICSMKPINKNITIRSVIGRYLEHSRMYYFHNSGIYISSADLLTRNLDRRVEILIPLEEENIKIKALSILTYYFKDNVNTYVMNKEGKYSLLKNNVSNGFNIHNYFMEEAVKNYKLRTIPKMSLKHNKK